MQVTTVQRPLNELMSAIGLCQPNRYCQYHAQKRNNLALFLPPFYFASEIGESATIQARVELVDAIHKMEDDFRLAGSWQLMGEQRDWFLRRIAKSSAITTGRLAFAILGIPGVTHLLETEKLVRSVVGSSAQVDFFVVERCICPLIDISNHLTDKGLKRADPATTVVSLSTQILLKSGNTSFELTHCDVSKGLPFATRSLDFISAHLLFSFLNAESSSVVLTEVARSLKRGGHFIAAQEPTDYMCGNVKAYFGRQGLEIDDLARSWNIYALSPEQRSSLLHRHGITVENNTFLLDFCASPNQG